MNELQYEQLEPISRHDAEAAFSSGDTDSIISALLSLSYFGEEPEWTQSKCLEFMQMPDRDIKRVAITAIGHLARVTGQIDRERVLPILETLGRDEEYEGIVGDALDDIAIFA